MSESAQVSSIEALQRLQASLARFGVDAQAILCGADLVVRRALDWVDEQLKVWVVEARKRSEEVGRARADLSFRRAMHDGQRVGCSEQEIALLKAQQRLREGEDKVQAVRRWQRQLPEALRDYEGPARQLAAFLDGDLRQALALLERKRASLEAYTALASAAPPAPEPASAALPADSSPAPEPGAS
jgi:hypothetical protein